MANKERGLFKVTHKSGKEVTVQQMRINGERWYSTDASAQTYTTKQEIIDCKFIKPDTENNKN